MPLTRLFRRRALALAVCSLAAVVAYLFASTERQSSRRVDPHRCADGSAAVSNCSNDNYWPTTSACREFFKKYFDDRGYLQCFVRWGANDGPRRCV